MRTTLLLVAFVCVATALTATAVVLPSGNTVSIRPGKPPDPLGGDLAIRPGKPPDPLGGDLAIRPGKPPDPLGGD